MDVWVNFTHATKFQAEGIFKCFFPFKAASAASSSSSPSDTSQQNLPLPKRKYNSIPLLEEVEINELAKRFADAIPEDELSVGSITWIRTDGIHTLLTGCQFARVSPSE